MNDFDISRHSAWRPEDTVPKDAWAKQILHEIVMKDYKDNLSLYGVTQRRTLLLSGWQDRADKESRPSAAKQRGQSFNLSPRVRDATGQVRLLRG